MGCDSVRGLHVGFGRSHRATCGFWQVSQGWVWILEGLTGLDVGWEGVGGLDMGGCG